SEHEEIMGATGVRGVVARPTDRGLADGRVKVIRAEVDMAIHMGTRRRSAEIGALEFFGAKAGLAAGLSGGELGRLGDVVIRLQGGMIENLDRWVRVGHVLAQSLEVADGMKGLYPRTATAHRLRR